MSRRPRPGRPAASRLASKSDMSKRVVRATAAQGLLGRDFRVTQRRGRWITSHLAPYVLATVHPSAILRAQDDDFHHEEMRGFVDDLRVVAEQLYRRKAA
jgi:uracil-DNA glycosylase